MLAYDTLHARYDILFASCDKLLARYDTLWLRYISHMLLACFDFDVVVRIGVCIKKTLYFLLHFLTNVTLVFIWVISLDIILLPPFRLASCSVPTHPIPPFPLELLCFVLFYFIEMTTLLARKWSGTAVWLRYLCMTDILHQQRDTRFCVTLWLETFERWYFIISKTMGLIEQCDSVIF
jgi:hypothetical protein